MRARLATPVGRMRPPLPMVSPDWVAGDDPDAGTPQAQLAAALRHELRTPLATALMYMSIAERSSDAGNTDGGVRSALSVARKQIERIELLVERVTDLEQLRRPALAARLADLSRIVGEVVRNTRKVAGEKASLLTMRGGPRRILGWWDQGAVEQILHNLLSNALKFGKGKPIDVSVTPDADGVHLIVRDYGDGIPSGDHKRIFERGVHAPADKSGGLGLGLWLVRALAEAHGGGVTVSSMPGLGSTFEVLLRPLHASRRGAMAAARRFLGT